ncbi:MAG: hypothetical protein ACR2KV_14960 [Solirubrobacteraceae bacterium]
MSKGFFLALAAAAGLGGAAVAAAQIGGGSPAQRGALAPSGTLTARSAGSTARPSALPAGSPGERTHPRVKPAVGSRRTRFAVAFTLAAQPGHQGVLATDYQVQVDAPKCPPPMLALVDAGTPGSTVRMPLVPPAHGWCLGRHKVTVLLQRGPYCPRPSAGQPPTPCPEFASQDLDVGEAYFTVRRPSR